MMENGDRPSQRGLTRGLDSNPRPEPRGAAAGPGRPTLKNQIQPTRYHRRPIASIIHMQYRTLHKEKTCMHDGLPMWFHTRGVVSCRILQSPGKSPNTSLLPEENTPDIEQKTNGALTVQWTSMMNFHESNTDWNASGTLWQ